LCRKACTKVSFGQRLGRRRRQGRDVAAAAPRGPPLADRVPPNEAHGV